MKNTSTFLLSFALITAITSESRAFLCHDFYKSAKGRAHQTLNTSEFNTSKAHFAALTNVNLEKFRTQEASQVASGRKMDGLIYLPTNDAIDLLREQFGNRSWSTREVYDALNEVSIRRLENFKPFDPYDRRFDALTLDLSNRVLRSISVHPVVGMSAAHRYNRPGVEIGYCFGRGCYVDLMAMRLGLDRDSIKKIWAVGPMGIWAFHIGDAYLTSDAGWVAVDNVPGYRALSIRNWFAEFKKQNRNGDLRLYITDADKFTAAMAGPYNKFQMGLTLPGKQDYYQDYFDHLIEWFEKATDAEIANLLGLSELPQRPAPIMTPEQKRASDLEEAAYGQLPPTSIYLGGTSASSTKHGVISTIREHFSKWKNSFRFSDDNDNNGNN